MDLDGVALHFRHSVNFKHWPPRLSVDAIWIYDHRKS
jgi:hypothetical protein